MQQFELYAGYFINFSLFRRQCYPNHGDGEILSVLAHKDINCVPSKTRIAAAWDGMKVSIPAYTK